MGPNEEHVDDALADYAFGASDAADAARVERHLGVCPRCTALATGDEAAVAQIGFAAPRRRPPPDVRARLMGRVAREGPPAGAPMLATHADGADGLPPVHAMPRRLSRPAPRWVLAAALLPWLAVVGLGAALVSARRTPASPRPALAVLPLHGARGITGRLAMDPHGTAAFLAITHLSPLPRGQTYVCWLKRDGGMDVAATFGLAPRSDDAFVRFHAPRPMGRYTFAVITLENTPLPARPHLPFLAAGPLS